MSQTAGYAAIMLLSGIGVPVLAALNAALGGRIGSPAAASCVLFAVAMIFAIAATIITGPSAFKSVAAQPSYLFLGGGLVAFYVLSITYIAPHFGLGNAIFFVLLGQLLSAALIDHYGLFGAREVPVSLMRGLGLVVMAFGVFLTQRG